MTDSYSLPEANDTEHQELLTHLKKLGLTTDDELVRMSSESPEEFQKFIDGLLVIKKRLQDDFRQLIIIKDVIEKYLNRLISEMLDGKDVIESLQQGMKIYPSIRFISWLIEEEEQENLDLTEFIKGLNLDNDYALPILYRWKYEYKPLEDIWWELRRREEGRENSWTTIKREPYYNQLRRMPQISIQLLSRGRIIWNAREDIDDIAELARALLVACLTALSTPQEYPAVSSTFLESIIGAIRRIEEVIEKLKALHVLSPQNISEDSTQPDLRAETIEVLDPGMLVSIPYVEDSIEKVSYQILDEYFNLIIIPKDGLLFSEEDVVFTTDAQLPMLSKNKLKEMDRTKDNKITEFNIRIPYKLGSIKQVSYIIAGNYLHIVLHGGITSSFDKSEVKFARSVE